MLLSLKVLFGVHQDSPQLFPMYLVLPIGWPDTDTRGHIQGMIVVGSKIPITNQEE